MLACNGGPPQRKARTGRRRMEGRSGSGWQAHGKTIGALEYFVMAPGGSKQLQAQRFPFRPACLPAFGGLQGFDAAQCQLLRTRLRELTHGFNGILDGQWRCGDSRQRYQQQGNNQAITQQGHRDILAAPSADWSETRDAPQKHAQKRKAAAAAFPGTTNPRTAYFSAGASAAPSASTATLPESFSLMRAALPDSPRR